MDIIVAALPFGVQAVLIEDNTLVVRSVADRARLVVKMSALAAALPLVEGLRQTLAG